jgi:hypothetical protein
MPLEAPTAERPPQTAVWRPICDVISQKAFRAEKQAIRRIHGGRKSVTLCSESAAGVAKTFEPCPDAPCLRNPVAASGRAALGARPQSTALAGLKVRRFPKRFAAAPVRSATNGENKRMVERAGKDLEGQCWAQLPEPGKEPD